jgi:hypothetical protein
MEELIKLITGKTLEDVRIILNKKGLHHRVVLVDGKACGITDDFEPYRVNMTLENNIVTKVDFG